jgi:hypothetical protein
MHGLSTNDLADLLDPRAEVQPHVAAQLAQAYRIWFLSDGSVGMPRGLGLPGTPQQIRRVLRDWHLRHAAAPIDGDAWARSLALSERLRAFMGHEWHCWQGLDAPPAWADEVDRRLWYAARAARGRLPKSPQSLYRVLGGTPQIPATVE